MTRSMLIGYKTVSEALVRVLSFLLAVLAARWLLREEFGLFSLAWTAGWIISVASDFGLQLYLAREVARRPERAWEILRPLLRIRLAAAAALFLSTALVGFLLRPWSLEGLAFLLLIGVQIGTSLIEFLNYFYRGLSRSELESTINLVQRLAGLLLAAAVLSVFPSLMGLAAALMATTGLTLAWSGTICRRVGGQRSRPETGEAAPGLSWNSFRSGVLPIGAGVLLSTLYFRVDVFMVEWWEGTEAVAVYSAIFRLVDGLRLLPAAVLAVVFPEMCRDRTGRVAAWTCGALIVPALLLMLLVGHWSETLVGLFYGPNYLRGDSTFKVLLLALPLLFVNLGMTHQLMAWNLQRYYALLCLAALAGNVGLNWLLIPRFSIEGAAWATLGTEALLGLGCIGVLCWRGSQEISSASGEKE